jgi:hypothetical protein
MALPARRLSLPKASLFLGIATAGLIGTGLVIGMVGTLAAAIWRRAGLITSAIALIALALVPPLGIVTIAAGHLSRRKYPHDGPDRTALIMGTASWV